MADVLPPSGHPIGLPYAIGGTPVHTAPPAAFNGYGASMAAPPRHYMAQGSGKQPRPVNDSLAANGLTGHQQPLNDKVSNAHPVPPRNYMAQAQPGPQLQPVNYFPAPSGLTGDQAPLDNKASNTHPEVTTSELKKPEEPPATDEQLKAMSDTQLYQEGEKRLDSAKKAYTKHAEFDIAQQTRKALKLFIETSATFNGNASDLVSKLKNITLPAEAPKGLSVTIKYPDKAAFSLIPPDEKHLGIASIEDITKWYRLADQAMGKWSETNMKGTDTLASAKWNLDNTLLALKAVRDAIDQRHKDKTGKPGNSQLEVEYQRHIDNGVTIKFDANEDELQYSAGIPPRGQQPLPQGHPLGSMGSSKPPIKPDEKTAPAPTPAAGSGEGSKTPEPHPLPGAGVPPKNPVIPPFAGNDTLPQPEPFPGSMPANNNPTSFRGSLPHPGRNPVPLVSPTPHPESNPVPFGSIPQASSAGDSGKPATDKGDLTPVSPVSVNRPIASPGKRVMPEDADNDSTGGPVRTGPATGSRPVTPHTNSEGNNQEPDKPPKKVSDTDKEEPMECISTDDMETYHPPGEWWF